MRLGKMAFILGCAAWLGVSGCMHGEHSAIAQDAVASSIAPEVPSDMSQLAERDEIVAAFGSIEDMDAQNIERMIAINEIPAPPFDEAARASDIARRISALGLQDVKIDEVGNVVARRKGSGNGRTVAIVAHIDTVFPAETDVTVRREGDVFYAPGIGDNTRGVVAMLSLIEVMEQHNIQTEADILFVGDVGEEGLGDLRGVRHLFREGADPIDAMIAIDGGDLSRLVTTAVGSHRYRVTFKGPGGHSYGAFGRAHPHQALAEAITRFTETATPITQSGPKATFSVGRIGGGTSINSIPFTSWMEVDMRSANPGKLAELDAAFQSAMQDALETENARRQSNDPLTIDIQSVGKRPAGATDPASSLIQNAGAAISYFGFEPSFTASSTDANIPMSLGIPAITISRGGISRNAHAPNESWENKEAHLAIQAALLMLIAEAGLK